MPTAAVILAGGRGERLGGAVKASIRVGGISLLDRVTTAIGPDAAPLLVAGGAFSPDRLGLGPRHVAVPDLPLDYAGPLAGLAAAAGWLQRQPAPPALLLSIAVDTPFVPADYLARLTAALPAAAAAVVARHDGQDYPTNALWRLAALAGLPAAMAAGTAPRSLRRFAAGLGAIHLDWPTVAGGDPFAGVNTPAELATAERRASGGGNAR